MYSGLFSGVLAVNCFAATISFKDEIEHIKFLLAILEVSLVISSFILLSEFANKWKNKFLDKRREAEYLRSLIWFKNAQIQVYPLTQIQNVVSDSDDFRKILEIEK